MCKEGEEGMTHGVEKVLSACRAVQFSLLVHCPLLIVFII